MMKKIFKGVVTVGVLFLLFGCAAGPVDDKRAPGMPGHKTYQLQIDDPNVLAPDDFWVTVTEKQWDDCELGERYPACTS